MRISGLSYFCYGVYCLIIVIGISCMLSSNIDKVETGEFILMLGMLGSLFNLGLDIVVDFYARKHSVIRSKSEVKE